MPIELQLQVPHEKTKWIIFPDIFTIIIIYFRKIVSLLYIGTPLVENFPGKKIIQFFKNFIEMKPAEKQAAIDRLLDELTKNIKEYNDCLRRDEVFVVKKKLRMRLKEIQNEIEALKSVPEDQQETI